MIDITGIDRAKLVLNLHNGTRAQGMGVLHDRPMTLARAREVLAKFTSDPVRLDYVDGRPIKVTLDGNSLEDERLYDRDAGPGACARAVAACRS